MFNPLNQSLRLEQARQRLALAKERYHQEKSDPSRWVRLKDSLTHTPTEEEYDSAQVGLSVVEDEIAQKAPSWVEAGIIDLARGSFASQGAPMLQMLPNLTAARETYTKIKRMRGLALTALAELRDAISQCDAAASGELMDVMSPLRQSSALSDDETDEAEYAVQRANSAMFRLGTGIEMAMSEVMGEPGGGDAWWRKTLDFDVSSLSGLNLAALGRTTEEIKKMLPHVEQLAASLATAADRQEKLLEGLCQAYAVHEEPLRIHVLQSLPENIQALLSKRGLCARPPLEQPQGAARPASLDLAAVRRVRDSQ